MPCSGAVMRVGWVGDMTHGVVHVAPHSIEVAQVTVEPPERQASLGAWGERGRHTGMGHDMAWRLLHGEQVSFT